jgi:tetratricopeptide (TPR) repeat protein
MHGQQQGHIMRWQATEFVFKGIYLGMLLFVGLALRQRDAWPGIAQVGVCTFGTLALFMGVAALRKHRGGHRVRGRLGALALFLLLENPGMVYAGVLLGMLLGAYSLLAGFGVAGAAVEGSDELQRERLLYCVLGGAVLGLLFHVLHRVQSLKARRWLGVALGAGMLAGGIYGLPELVPSSDERMTLAVLLLLGIPLFYLLTLASITEESEVEIMAICAALGVSLWTLTESWLPGNSNVQLATLVIPVALYYLYTRYVLPELRVFKHVLRGISYAHVGQIRPALMSLGRALQLDPAHAVAREQVWHVHRLMDFSKVVKDPATLSLLDFELCLDRAAKLLLADKPSPDHLEEAHRLLDLVASQRPDMMPRCDYWQAVALTHERRYDEAAGALERVLSGQGTAANPHRRAVLFPAWQLAVMLHPELARRVGAAQLAVPGRRMNAIAAVEQQLAGNAEDAAAWDLKRVLYNDLTEAEFQTQVVQDKPQEKFDYGYVQQLGVALINDPAGWEKGCEFLRMAAAGLPAQAPTMYLAIARAQEKAGNFAEVWAAYEAAKQAVQSVGQKNLGPEDRQVYFAMVKALGEDAAKRGDTAAAIDNFRLFAEYERAGINTYRTLAELYERQGDAWTALYATEQGLLYDARDEDLLTRKDRYCYSVMPQDLETRKEQVQKWFDVAYCKGKARWLLDHQGENLELLDWASHLADLAQVMEPAGLAARVLRARILRRRGEIDQAIALLEEVRGGKPEKFASDEDEEAWYLSCRLLGDLYLNVKPDQAILCFQEYRKHGKSGADTVYKMGVAYENLGDYGRARKCYEMVAAYEGHPLRPDANSALHRLQTTPQ